MGVQLGVGRNGNAWNINKIKCLKKKEQQTDTRKYAMEREQRIKAIRNTNFLDLLGRGAPTDFLLISFNLLGEW